MFTYVATLGREEVKVIISLLITISFAEKKMFFILRVLRILIFILIHIYIRFMLF